MHAVHHFDPLIKQIYGAIGRPEVWSDVLADITARMGGAVRILELKFTRVRRRR
jgi:hypothetical protein